MGKNIIRDEIKQAVTRVVQWMRSGREEDRRRRPFVLCYHSISEHEWSLAISPATLRLHIGILQEMGFEFLTYAQWVAALKEGSRRIRNAVALTFDDGLEDNYTAAMPVLLEAGVKATFFIPTGLVAGDRQAIGRHQAESGYGGGFLTPDQLREMRRKGMELGTHSHRHCALARLSETEAWSELTESKRVLEQIIGEPVTSMAYPFGARHLHYSQQVCELAQQAGYLSAARVLPRTVNHRRLPSLFEIPRFCISKDDTEDLFVQKCLGYFDWFAVYQGWRERCRAAMGYAE